VGGRRAEEPGVPPGGTFSQGFALNDRGQIVGRTDGHAFIWQDGTFVLLDRLEGGTEGIAFGINARGDVVGQADNAAGEPRATLWTRGKS
jgi:probable HAF family extracellular repeat protein